MKKYLFGILAITLAVGFSAFTTKKAPKPFTSVDVWLADGSNYQRLESGFNFGADPETSLTQTRFNTQIGLSQWTTTAASATAYVTGASYAIKFTISNYNPVDDANDANGITVQEALDELKINATSPALFDGSGDFVYPTSGVTVNPSADATTVLITFDKNATAH